MTIENRDNQSEKRTAEMSIKQAPESPQQDKEEDKSPPGESAEDLKRDAKKEPASSVAPPVDEQAPKEEEKEVSLLTMEPTEEAHKDATAHEEDTDETVIESESHETELEQPAEDSSVSAAEGEGASRSLDEARNAYAKAYAEFRKKQKFIKKNIRRVTGKQYTEEELPDGLKRLRDEYEKIRKEKAKEFITNVQSDKVVEIQIKVIQQFIIDEYQLLAKAGLESYPPKERNVALKLLDLYRNVPMPLRIIGTSIVIGAGSFLVPWGTVSTVSAALGLTAARSIRGLVAATAAQFGAQRVEKRSHVKEKYKTAQEELEKTSLFNIDGTFSETFFTQAVQEKEKIEQTHQRDLVKTQMKKAGVGFLAGGAAAGAITGLDMLGGHALGMGRGTGISPEERKGGLKNLVTDDKIKGGSTPPETPKSATEVEKTSVSGKPWWKFWEKQPKAQTPPQPGVSDTTAGTAKTTQPEQGTSTAKSTPTEPKSEGAPAAEVVESSPAPKLVKLNIGARGPEGAIIDYFRENKEVAKSAGWDGSSDMNEWVYRKAHLLWLAEAKEALKNEDILKELKKLGYPKTEEGYAEMMHRIKAGTVTFKADGTIDVDIDHALPARGHAPIVAEETAQPSVAATPEPTPTNFDQLEPIIKPSVPQTLPTAEQVQTPFEIDTEIGKIPPETMVAEPAQTGVSGAAAEQAASLTGQQSSATTPISATTETPAQKISVGLESSTTSPIISDTVDTIPQITFEKTLHAAGFTSEVDPAWQEIHDKTVGQLFRAVSEDPRRYLQSELFALRVNPDYYVPKFRALAYYIQSETMFDGDEIIRKWGPLSVEDFLKQIMYV
ncbi:MAG TPA: hypothetical protein VJH96_04090 [Patescibacteria group bacterium]|nr:hypothetical protein [Patescibacteria group bacterium]